MRKVIHLRRRCQHPCHHCSRFSPQISLLPGSCWVSPLPWLNIPTSEHASCLQDLLKCNETLHSPLSICSHRSFQPLHLPLLTCCWAPVGAVVFAAQAEHTVKPVILCGCCCSTGPGPRTPADLHSLACRPPTTGLKHTIPQVGTHSPHI